MSYIPDPSDSAEPLDSRPVSTAAAEFRALKGYVGTKDVLPVVPPAGAYQLVLTDRGKHIFKTDAAAITVPANATVAFPLGAIITLVNENAGDQSILAAGGVTLRLSGSTSTGTRTIANYGSATLLKVATNTWHVMGAGVT